MKKTIIVAIVLIGLTTVVPAFAQPVFVEPTSPAGGATASPLNSSSTTQRKLGSLIIGSSSAPKKLCLNSDPTLGDTDSVNCISSWGAVTGGAGFVFLNTTSFSASPPASVLEHTTTQAPGYARVRADSTKNQLYTFIAEANSASTTAAAAVYATDGGQTTNFAGYFQGRLYVGGSGGDDRELCLNGTGAITNGKGCITSWSAITGLAPSGNYVLLQASPGPLTAQTGGAALSGSLQVASSNNTGVAIGAPTAGTSLSYTCGDGICSSTTNPPETVGTCAMDCGTPSYPVTVNMLGSWGDSRIYDTSGKINCPGVCSAAFTESSVVQLLMDLDAFSYEFDGYSGDCTGPSCSVVVNGQKTINATFSLR